VSEELKSLLTLLALIFLAPAAFGVALVAIFFSEWMKGRK
jgi:hypothetical protein